MNILAIDTSCDETSVAVTNGQRVLGNVIFSQVKLHAPYGGVYPTIAKREHLTKINPAIALVLKKAHMQITDIDAFAVTFGPGLAPALEIGINKAKKLALQFHKPLIPVNHLEGHIYSSFLRNKNNQPNRKIIFPLLSLVASGGHTEIVWMKEDLNYQILGATLDDAVGESLDKAAKMLGLGYPGGPIIEKLAQTGNENKYPLPIPMLKSADLNYSYSGLKTAFKRLVGSLSEEERLQNLNHLCASFQKAAFVHLLDKFNKAIAKTAPKMIILGGGVIDNKLLRQKVRQLISNQPLPTYFPFFKYASGDNAAMIGIVADLKFTHQKYLQTRAEINSLDRNPRASLNSSCLI